MPRDCGADGTKCIAAVSGTAAFCDEQWQPYRQPSAGSTVFQVIPENLLGRILWITSPLDSANEKSYRQPYA